MFQEFKILQNDFPVCYLQCGWIFVVMNRLKEALRGVRAAGCWLERQQGVRIRVTS